MTRRLFIIRHGNTFAPGEPPRRIGAGTDLPLVESGIVQARALGTFFAAERLTVRRILAGPLRRARETAERIAAALGTAVAGSPDWLNEIDHGPDEGRAEADVLARIGAQALAAWDEQGVAPPGWRVDADSRIAAWRALFADGGEGEGADLLVTSNGAARFALLALGAPAGSLKLRTGAFGEIALEEGATRLVRWNVRP